MKTITEDGEVIDTVTHEPIAMAPPFFKTPWNHNTNAESDAVALECKDPSKTQQQFAAEADINNILRKFQQTGELPLTGSPQYAWHEEEFELLNKIVTADQVDEAWNALTPEQRNILRDPRTFVAYVDHCMECGDIEPLRKLGLAKPEPQEQAVTPPVVPPATPATPSPVPAPPGPTTASP